MELGICYLQVFPTEQLRQRRPSRELQATCWDCAATYGPCSDIIAIPRAQGRSSSRRWAKRDCGNHLYHLYAIVTSSYMLLTVLVVPSSDARRN